MKSRVLDSMVRRYIRSLFILGKISRKMGKLEISTIMNRKRSNTLNELMEIRILGELSMNSQQSTRSLK